jgi:hypothetical protein
LEHRDIITGGIQDEEELALAVDSNETAFKALIKG